MRAKYRQLGAVPPFQRLTASCPTMATWDDHDYGVNDGGADYVMRKEAQQAFLDFWKVTKDSPRRSREGIYHAKVFGDEGRRLQVVLLDTRYFRSPLKKGPVRRVGGPYVPDEDPSKTILGDDQWQWLKQTLQEPADLRVIVSSIQFAASAAGQETWSNLPKERKQMLSLIKETNATGVMFISGDRHWAELSRIDREDSYPIYDLTSSSLNQMHGRGTPTENRYRISEKTYHRENYGVLSIDWEKKTVEMSIRDMQSAKVIQCVIPFGK